MRNLPILIVFILPPAVFGQGVELTPIEEYEKLPTLNGVSDESLDSSPPMMSAPPVASEPPIVSAPPPVDTAPAEYELSLEDSPAYSPPMLSFPSPGAQDAYADSLPLGEMSAAPSIGYVEGFGTYGHYDLKDSVDLRDFLPTPGKQEGNSCFSWAAGYASYTCQICQERHQTNPSQPWQTFSADYIFSRIPDSSDGVNAKEVFKCLQEDGCASLAASQPGKHPEVEGRLFLAERHERATSLDDIKVFLSQGYPVILVVQLDAEFEKMSNGDAPYVWRGAESQPRYHAICAVGFDSDQRKVLIMNSAGTDWKDGGFCWVDESNLANVNRQSWCVEAHVFKVKKSRPLTVEDLTAGFMSQQHFLPAIQLKPDKRIYDEWDDPISPASLKFDDVTWTKHKVFALRDNFKVYRQDGSEWCTMTAGLDHEAWVTMIAGAGELPVHALTNEGKLYRADNNFIWKSVVLPSTSRVVDIRTVDEELFAVSDAGSVFEYVEGAWKEQAEP